MKMLEDEIDRIVEVITRQTMGLVASLCRPVLEDQKLPDGAVFRRIVMLEVSKRIIGQVATSERGSL